MLKSALLPHARSPAAIRLCATLGTQPVIGGGAQLSEAASPQLCDTITRYSLT